MKSNTINEFLALRAELDNKLSNVELTDRIIQRSNSAFHTAQEYLIRLKDLQPDSFIDETSEIEYYKTVSPLFHAYVIYFHRVCQLESSIFPSESIRRKRYRKEQKDIRLYIEENLKAYRYFITDDDSFDREFFVANHMLTPTIVDESELLADLRHTTPMALKFARFIAYEKLSIFLDARLRKSGNSSILPDGIKVKWTDKKIFLHQLTYALVYSKCINNGEMTVKNLARVFETIFDIDLSNTYRARQDMYSQKNPAFFLDIMKSAYLEGMNAADDRYNKRQ